MRHITIRSLRSSVSDQANEITLVNLKQEEVEALTGMMKGRHWVTIDDGRLTISPRLEPLPKPTQDEEMMPFWRRHEFPLDGKLQVNTYDPERLKNNWGASIQIQSLCGYNYSKENYQIQAEKLIGWVFICLRSRRENNGRFQEIWHLAGIWAVKGELALELQAKKMNRKDDEQNKLQTAISYLCANVQFGSLDVTVQRAAMVQDD